jgi:hypothetical protein
MQRSTILNVSDRKGVLSQAESPYDRLPAMLKPVLRDWTWARDEAPSCGALTFAGDGLCLVALDYLNADWPRRMR